MSVESFYLFLAVFLVVITLVILAATIHVYRVRDRHFQEAKKRVDEHWRETKERIDNNIGKLQ